MKEGDYLYCVEQDLLGPELHIRRVVLLAYDEKVNRFELGDSKARESRFCSGHIDRDLWGWHETPVEAVNHYVAQRSEHLKKSILSHEAEIKVCQANLKALKKLDHTKLKVKKYADDWTPCDF